MTEKQILKEINPLIRPPLEQSASCLPLEVWIPLLWTEITKPGQFKNATEARKFIDKEIDDTGDEGLFDPAEEIKEFTLTSPLHAELMTWTQKYPQIIRVWFIPSARAKMSIFDSPFGYGLKELIVRQKALNVFQRLIIDQSGKCFPGSSCEARPGFAARLAYSAITEDHEREPAEFRLLGFSLNTPKIIRGNVVWERTTVTLNKTKKTTEIVSDSLSGTIWSEQIKLAVQWAKAPSIKTDDMNNDPLVVVRSSGCNTFRTLFPTGFPSSDYSELQCAYEGITDDNHFFYQRVPNYIHLMTKAEGSDLVFKRLIQSLGDKGFLARFAKESDYLNASEYFVAESLKQQARTAIITCAAGTGLFLYDLYRIVYGTDFYKPNRCLKCGSVLPTRHSGRKYCSKTENPICRREYDKSRKRAARAKF